MPKIVDHDQRRAIILDGAFTAFVKRGYASLSMRDLAREIGVTLGGLYHYFPGKEELFLALVGRFYRLDYLNWDSPPNLTRRQKLLLAAEQLQRHEATIIGSLALLMDYVQVQGKPFSAEDSQSRGDLLEQQVAHALELTPTQARLFRQQVVGLLILRRLTPSALPLSEALRPLIDSTVPPE
ncbi:helix-turn-helix domain-containing protein [Deinococcus sp. UYEF24]